MADLYCIHCGEPIDMDEFHDAERGTFREWISAFKVHGCSAVDAMFAGETPDSVLVNCSSSSRVSDETKDKLHILQDLLGDDVDGLSAMSEDMMGGWL